MSDFDNYVTNPDYLAAYDFDGKGYLYVEDESDIPFWEEIVSQIIPNKYHVKPAVQGSESIRGKHHLEKRISQLHDKFLIAIDSDFDFICPNGRLPNSLNINNNKFILQTYLYSRESFQFSREQLVKVMSKIKYTIKPEIDILKLVDIFSYNCFELLTKFIYLKEKKISIVIDGRSFREKKLCEVLSIPKKSKITDKNFCINYNLFNKHKSDIDSVTLKINPLISDVDDYEAFKEDLDKKGLNVINACLFISGHVYESYINQIFEHVISLLLIQEIDKIKKEVDGVMVEDKINKVKKHFRDFCCYKTMIYQGEINYSNSHITKICHDIGLIYN